MLAPVTSSEGIALPPVLIVDANADNRELYRTYFERIADVTVREAATGEEALLVLTHPPQPDVVVFDLVLPDVDGFAFCQQLAEANVEQPPSLVVLTGWPLRDAERTRLGTLGVSRALQKPCLPHELLANVRAVRAVAAQTRDRAATIRLRAEQLQRQSEILQQRSRDIVTRLQRS